MTVRLLDWAVRHYLAAVHRYPIGVAVEAVIAWACVWRLAHTAPVGDLAASSTAPHPERTGELERAPYPLIDGQLNLIPW